jgi:hypothetical protein
MLGEFLDKRLVERQNLYVVVVRDLYDLIVVLLILGLDSDSVCVNIRIRVMLGMLRHGTCDFRAVLQEAKLELPVCNNV